MNRAYSPRGARAIAPLATTPEPCAQARHSRSKRASASSRRRRASAGVREPLSGFIALFVFAFGKAPFLNTRLKSSVRATGRRKKGSVGNFDGAPEIRLAVSSIDRATCSTIWLGDHLPVARGVVHVAAQRSAADASSFTASRLAVSVALRSAMRTSTDAAAS